MTDTRPENGGHPYRFPKSLHIRRPAEFQKVYRRRVSTADHQLIIYARSNSRPYSRLGLAISRKTGNAVVRNRWKRLIREAFRLNRRRLPAGLDLVVLAKRQPVRPTLDSITASLLRLTHKLARRLPPTNKETIREKNDSFKLPPIVADDLPADDPGSSGDVAADARRGV